MLRTRDMLSGPPRSPRDRVACLYRRGEGSETGAEGGKVTRSSSEGSQGEDELTLTEGGARGGCTCIINQVMQGRGEEVRHRGKGGGDEVGPIPGAVP